jgi:catechol 2,3-dioxygenase-like lactoylglutathione lyase family enzyme
MARAKEEAMKPRIHVITLAVSDLGRALAFYRDGLGLESAGIVGTEFPGDETNPAGALAMFHLEGGLILAAYPRSELAKDARIPFGPSKSGEFSIGHIVDARADVDALLAAAEAAGATVTDRPHERPWGIYSGYFRDPDGHLWEVIWNSQREGA